MGEMGEQLWEMGTRYSRALAVIRLTVGDKEK